MKITEGTLIALPIRWQGSQSGCVEWTLVGWTVRVDGEEPLPITSDGGETGAWGSDYAIRGPEDLEWRFPDGERCYDKGLVAAFARRAGTSLGEYKPNRAERRALARQRKLIKQAEEALESLEAQGKLRSVICEDGERRWIARDQVH